MIRKVEANFVNLLEDAVAGEHGYTIWVVESKCNFENLEKFDREYKTIE